MVLSISLLVVDAQSSSELPPLTAPGVVEVALGRGGRHKLVAVGVRVAVCGRVRAGKEARLHKGRVAAVAVLGPVVCSSVC